MISEGAVVVDEKLDREAGADLEALFLERMPKAADDLEERFGFPSKGA